MTSALFRHIERLQGDRPWGRFLDAGSGVNSALWSTDLAVTDWTGVTASTAHADQIRTRAPRAAAPGRLVIGDWVDPALLGGEVFDTVLADYLLGAVEGFAPYFQADLFARLRPLVGGILYVVGLDPYVVGPAPTPEARMVREIGRFRDSVLLLADEGPYREYPVEWTLATLERSGFRILNARRFPNRYRERWIDGQIDMAMRRLERMGPTPLARALAEHGEALRDRARAMCRAGDGLRAGADYVIAAEPT